MKIVPFKLNDSVKIEDIADFKADIEKGEVVSYVTAWLRNDGVVITDKQGDVIKQCGLLAFLDAEVKSQIDV